MSDDTWGQCTQYTPPTKEQMREAGYCLECEGHGWLLVESVEIQCKHCGGTGEAAPEKK